MGDEFRQFWAIYPRRVAKLAAMTAFARARKVADLSDILAGVQVYIANKPAYADWAHPATWLNQGRWMDEYEDRRTAGDRRQQSRGTPDRREPQWVPWRCPHTPECKARFQCHQKTEIERMKAEEQAS